VSRLLIGALDVGLGFAINGGRAVLWFTVFGGKTGVGVGRVGVRDDVLLWEVEEPLG